MPMQGISYRFSHAIVRRVGTSITDGLRAVDRGAPDCSHFRAEHGRYIRALERAGVGVTVLDELDAHPDSVFIEDAALCLPEGIVMMRPGAPSRMREATLLSATLADLGHRVIPNETDGTIDGGDVLITDSSVMVGLSERTDRAGFDWLASVLGAWGYDVQAVQTPGEVLHFKSDCCVIGSDTVLATERLADAACFEPFRVLTVPRGEEAAANTVRLNDTVLMPAGFPATERLLADEGLDVEVLSVSQAALLDGGLSCMSLRLPAVARPAG